MQGLGLEHGQQCVDRGCHLLVLTSRSGSVHKDVLSRLARTGGTVFALKADSSFTHLIAQVVEWTRGALPCIDHYAHAAGASGFAMLADMDRAEFHRVAATKVSGVAAQQSTLWFQPA
jgi:NAD(P)-dependent dehydrogenase (short-subunit alcohol dehydrogenase family)